jgi:hypothetical protein
MANPFSITAATDTIPLDAQGRGSITYTVSNVSGQPRRGRARLVPSDPTQASWLKVEGEVERSFTADGTHQYTVRVAVPPGTPAGRSMFGLDVVSVENPDEEWSQGPRVGFAIAPSVPAKKPFPWWIVVVLAGVLLVGGLVAWLASRDRYVEPVVDVEPAAEPATLRPLVLKAAGDPARIAQDQPTRIMVGVSADGSAVAGADVTLAAGGGAFANGATQITGQTDATGTFASAWSCSPCAPAYEISVEASKAGYEPATGSVTIAVGEAGAATEPALQEIVLPAKNYDGSQNAEVGVLSAYGDDVVHTGPPYMEKEVYMEYDVSFPKTGPYELWIEYAAQDSRPVTIFMNGNVVAQNALEATTGGWTPDHQKWRYQCGINADAGTNRLKIYRNGSIPHIRTIKFVPRKG